MTDAELVTLCHEARALTKGSLDPLFDAIFDAEAYLKGTRSMAATREEAERDLKDWVAKRKTPTTTKARR